MFLSNISKSLRSLLSRSRVEEDIVYRPTFFLRHHFLQSLYELTSPQIKINFEREQVYFPDGGHVSLDWSSKENA